MTWQREIVPREGGRGGALPYNTKVIFANWLWGVFYEQRLSVMQMILFWAIIYVGQFNAVFNNTKLSNMSMLYTCVLIGSTTYAWCYQSNSKILYVMVQHTYN